MKQYLPIGIVVVLAGVLLSCVTASPEVQSLSERSAPPIVLFWTPDGVIMERATHIVNRVWVGTQEDNPDKDPTYHRDAWLDRGVIPLDWAGGRVYADEGFDEVVRKWSSALEKGHVGIAIDELGSTDPAVDQLLASALLEVRRQHPDKYLAVWHAGLITPHVAEAYQSAADLIMLETYVSGETFLGLRFGFFLGSARRFDLQHKTIPIVAAGHEQFAETYAEVEAQMRWLSRNAADFAGIGFYAPKASPEMLAQTDELVAELYAGR